jgi:3-oxoadipate enol-lactonase
MRADLRGFAAYYEETGSGPPLVLVHGLGGSTAMFQKIAGPLAEDFRVIAYDLRGLGRSETPALPYSMDLLTGDLHGLLGLLGLERVVLVGHSLGGAVSLAYAIERPARVAALVGVAAASGTPIDQRPHLAARAELARTEGMDAIAELHARNGLPEDYRQAHPDDVAAYKAIIAGGDPEGYAGHCGVIAALDLSAGLGRIGAPVLLVQGELDGVVPAAAARATAASIPDCEYVELPGCGHVVPFERPAELVERIREFAGRLAPV